MARRTKVVPNWLALGAGCCGLSALLTGCASSQPAGVARLWETPPGVPAPHFSESASPGEGESNSGLAKVSPSSPGSRKWTDRSILPEKMLAALGGKRSVAQGDPFLADYVREAARPAEMLAESTPSSPAASAEAEAIALPRGHELKAVPGLTDALGRPQNGNDPLAIVSADHQPGEQVLKLNPGDSQLTRLQAAMDFDREQLEKTRVESQADEGMRDRVDRLMRQARTDLEGGRLAAAFKTAQQAESLATEVGLDFDNESEQPTILVEMLREKLQSDVKDPTELPPEESVETGADVPAPDLLSSRISGDRQEPGREVIARDVERERNPFESMDDEPAVTKSDVEILPPPPESHSGDALSIRRPASATPVKEVMEVATVVGPSSPIERAPQTDRLEFPPQPSDLEPRYASVEPSSPFWPGRSPEDQDSGVIDARPSVPATLGMPELNEPEDDDEAPQTATRNVDWRDSSSAIFRIDLKKLPKPLLAGVFVGAVWLLGFAAVKAGHFVRTMFRK